MPTFTNRSVLLTWKTSISFDTWYSWVLFSGHWAQTLLCPINQLYRKAKKLVIILFPRSNFCMCRLNDVDCKAWERLHKRLWSLTAAPWSSWSSKETIHIVKFGFTGVAVWHSQPEDVVATAIKTNAFAIGENTELHDTWQEGCSVRNTIDNQFSSTNYFSISSDTVVQLFNFSPSTHILTSRFSSPLARLSPLVWPG